MAYDPRKDRYRDHDVFTAEGARAFLLFLVVLVAVLALRVVVFFAIPLALVATGAIETALRRRKRRAEGEDGLDPASGPADGGPAPTAVSIGAAKWWCLGIAATSLLNLAAAALSTSWNFGLGLSMTAVLGWVVGHGGGAIAVVAALPALALCALFVGAGLLGARRRGLVLAALVVYGADTLNLSFLRNWLGLAIHAWAMFELVKGYRAMRRLPDGQAAVDASTDGTPPVIT